MNDWLLETENLSFSYEADCPILTGINLRVSRGEKVVLFGANGSGKSTLLMNLNGSLRPRKGTIRLNGEYLPSGRRGQERLSATAALLFQDPDDQLFSSTVYEDISFGPSCEKIEKNELERRLHEAIELFDLMGLQNRPVHHLSFGEKKRAALAGLFVMQTPIVLLDEPGSGMDPRSQDILLRSLGVWHDRGSTIVIATHDLSFGFSWADTILIMEEGRLISRHKKSDVLNTPELLSRARLTLPPALRLELAMKRHANSRLTLEIPDSLEAFVRMLEEA